MYDVVEAAHGARAPSQSVAICKATSVQIDRIVQDRRGHSFYRCGMQPRITVLTIGVDDLERALTFYRDGLGFETQGVIGAEFEYGAVVFFDLRGGLKLALWPRTSIARDAGVAKTPASPTDVTLGHNVRTRDEVDRVMAQIGRAHV